MIIWRFLIFLAAAATFFESGEAKRLPQIYWNSTNPLVERYAAIGDTLDIICPYSSSEEEGEGSEPEQSIIYRVSEEEYEMCEKWSTAKELGRCTQPYQREKLKVAFRLMSPNPSGLDYRPGTTYFFISTSTGTKQGLNNEQGGLCASHNLKMVIHVTDRNGNIGAHHHRHHHKTPTKIATTTQSAASSSTTQEVPVSEKSWDSLENAEKLWEQFYEKVVPIGNTWSPETSRAERVTLFAGNKKDEYVQEPSEVIDFEIHEIGDVESLYSSKTTMSSYLVATVTLFIFWRIL